MNVINWKCFDKTFSKLRNVSFHLMDKLIQFQLPHNIFGLL